MLLLVTLGFFWTTRVEFSWRTQWSLHSRELDLASYSDNSVSIRGQVPVCQHVDMEPLPVQITVLTKANPIIKSGVSMGRDYSSVGAVCLGVVNVIVGASLSMIINTM